MSYSRAIFRPTPSELLSSEALAELMETLKERYDYIFIDTPPVSAVIDAAVISKYTNGAVIVVRPGSTKKEELVNVVSQLEFADAKIVGFVLNCVDDEHGGYYYRGKYKYNLHLCLCPRSREHKDCQEYKEQFQKRVPEIEIKLKRAVLMGCSFYVYSAENI